MTQLHNQCLAEKCELEKEMKYLQVDQQDMRSSVYKLQQRMNFLKKKFPEIYVDIMTTDMEEFDPSWPTKEEYFEKHELATRRIVADANGISVTDASTRGPEQKETEPAPRAFHQQRTISEQEVTEFSLTKCHIYQN